MYTHSDGHAHEWTPPTSVNVEDCDVLTCWHVRIRYNKDTTRTSCSWTFKFGLNSQLWQAFNKMTQTTSFSRVLLIRKHQQFFRNLSWALTTELVCGSENHDLQGLPWQKRSCPTHHSSLTPLSRVVEGTPGRSVNGRWSDRTSCTRPSGPRVCHIRSDTSCRSPLPSSDNTEGDCVYFRRSPRGMRSWSLAAAWSCCWGNSWKEGFVYL